MMPPYSSHFNHTNDEFFMANELIIKDYYDPDTGTFSYLLADASSSECIVIDPVLGFDMVSAHTSMQPSEQLISDIEQNGWTLSWILETHAHADHLTSAQQLKDRFNAKVAIGTGITAIQKNFKSIYQFDDDYDTNGKAFDHLLSDGDTLTFGEFTVEVIATPGHTSDSLTYKVGKHLFIGDTLFHPEIGSARCDFPGGDAGLLFQSIDKLLSFGDDAVLCLCHDYPEGDRPPRAFFTVEEMKNTNIHLKQAGHDPVEFKSIRDERDADLDLPKLIIPSIQVNTQAGLELEQPNLGLKWPINRF